MTNTKNRAVIWGLESDDDMDSPIIANLPRGYRMDRQLGVVYDAPVTPADDLMQIDGIRTREAVLLNQLGVYYFGQLALWRHREMTAISTELHVPVSRIIDEAWIDQARSLCAAPASAPAADLPSTILRTVSLLACALLIGFFSVYLLGRQRNEPLTGLLSADITSLKVPANSKLTEVMVKPGQEVFSGQPLLKLEKLEHLQLIERQEGIVRDLERELKRAEAQAVIELEWRRKDVEKDLSEVLEHLSASRPAEQLNNPLPIRGGSRLNVRTVSSSRALRLQREKPKAGGIMFFGASGQHSQSTPLFGDVEASPEAQPVPIPKDIRVAEAPRNGVMLDAPAVVITSSEVAALEAEHARLEAVRSSLSQTVSEATGVNSLRARYDDASKELEVMKSVSREVTVTAPVYGVVGQVRFQQGDSMDNGEVLVRILHTDRRYVIVHLPTRRVHEMQAGAEVELLFPGRQEFRGQISEVPMLAESSGTTGESLAKVRIDPIGRLWPAVPVGSQVDVISLR